jgi:hypothetical protein
MAQREINPVLAGVVVFVVVVVLLAIMWFRAQPNTSSLPNQPPPGFGGAPVSNR